MVVMRRRKGAAPVSPVAAVAAGAAGCGSLAAAGAAHVAKGEDRAGIAPAAGGGAGRDMAVLADGHVGAAVAEAVVAALPRCLAAEGGAWDAAAVARAFAACNAEIRSAGLPVRVSVASFAGRVPAVQCLAFPTSRLIQYGWPRSQGGCVATVVVVDHGRWFCANAGDCRAVVGLRGGGFRRWTLDHRPDDPAEEARIAALGGFVAQGRLMGACVRACVRARALQS